MHWVFGVPLYVVDVSEMDAHNAALTEVIKAQFEELDANGWAADRTSLSLSLTLSLSLSLLLSLLLALTQWV